MHAWRSKLFLGGLVVLVFVGGAVVLRPRERAIVVPTLRTGTAVERRDSLWALQDAWDSRILVYSPDNEREERAFLNRLAYFVRSSRGREIYGPACQFWNRAYHDHASRYSDFIEDQG
jgi:hypothetical protein